MNNLTYRRLNISQCCMPLLPYCSSSSLGTVLANCSLSSTFRCWWRPCLTGEFSSSYPHLRWLSPKVPWSVFALLFTQFSVVSVEHLPAPLSECSATEKNQKPSAVCVLEKRGRLEKNLQALFIFQESRIVVKYCKYYSLCFLMASVCMTLANQGSWCRWKVCHLKPKQTSIPPALIGLEGVSASASSLGRRLGSTLEQRFLTGGRQASSLLWGGFAWVAATLPI